MLQNLYKAIPETPQAVSSKDKPLCNFTPCYNKRLAPTISHCNNK